MGFLSHFNLWWHFNWGGPAPPPLATPMQPLQPVSAETDHTVLRRPCFRSQISAGDSNQPKKLIQRLLYDDFKLVLQIFYWY